jgi:hypothetical protein
MTLPIALTAALMLLSTACSQAENVALVTFESQNMHMAIDVPAHAATITDSGRMTVDKGWNLFQLNHTAKISSFAINGSGAEYLTAAGADDRALPVEVSGNLGEIDTTGRAQLVLFKSGKAGSVDFSITYRAEFFEDVSQMRFSNEKVGGEVSGTILDKGAYLSPASFYYPQGTDGTMLFSMTADIPESWESVSDGNPVSTESAGGRKVQSWRNPFASDGNMFMAAPFVVKMTTVDSVEVACYFFEADTGLFESYLPATVGYIRTYSDLIGPYPFKRFSVVENFFPTGYGMPGWTLLGQQVIRLPFIVFTSLGHEVLHNWWGNSVYVDYERGNWCEGMTVYGADYRYKLQKSPDEARDYRKNILKAYVSYINEGNDFPVREFASRTSPGTRVIGYNKAMMVFHMIHQLIGEEQFFAAWKDIYASYKGEKIAWEDWLAAYEKASGVDLSYVLPEWIDRPGAPMLDVEIVSMTKNAGGAASRVDFRLSEKSGQVYTLAVPVRFAGGGETMDTTITLATAEADFSVTVPAKYTSIEIDPDYHLFRKLYPEEVEPIISGILGFESKRFVSFADDPALTGAFNSLATSVGDDSAVVDAPDILKKTARDFAPIMLNPKDLPGYLADMVTITDSAVILNGESYPRYGHTFVLSGQDFEGFEKYLVILTTDSESLPRVGQLIPHYGKYSYLVFAGARNVGKGQWPTTHSPLKKDLPL